MTRRKVSVGALALVAEGVEGAGAGVAVLDRVVEASRHGVSDSRQRRTS
jgi:hypothetical protein